MTVENEMVRSVLISAVIEIICRYYEMTPSEAMQAFYESGTAASLSDESSGLYGQSPLYNASLFIMEKEGKLDEGKLLRATHF